MVAQVTGLGVGDFIHTMGDVHIYANHVDQVKLQLGREPRKLPRLRLNPVRRELTEFVFEDVTLEDYDPYPAIKAPVAI
jgi:thymidylate synthase